MEKAFNKVQCPVMIKILSTLGIKGNFLDSIMGTHTNLQLNILNGEKRSESACKHLQQSYLLRNKKAFY